MGSVSEEYGDIVERLLAFWEKNHWDMVDLESIERWKKIFEWNGTNMEMQIIEPPLDEEGFLRLTIVHEKHGIKVKEFVVTNVLRELIERKRKHAEYFDTLKDGSNVGVSIEWKKKEEI